MRPGLCRACDVDSIRLTSSWAILCHLAVWLSDGLRLLLVCLKLALLAELCRLELALQLAPVARAEVRGGELLLELHAAQQLAASAGVARLAAAGTLAVELAALGAGQLLAAGG